MNRDDRLTQILQEWAARQTPTAQELERLQQRIVATLEAEPGPSTDAPHPLAERTPPGFARGRHALVGFALGAAATLLVVLGIWRNSRPLPRPTATEPQDSLPPAFTWLQEKQVDGKALLLGELQRLFGEKLAWVAESNGQIKLGLAADGETHSSAPVAVRLVVVRRHAADRTATPVWAVDLIAHSEQVVQLEPDSAPDAHLRVWAYLLPDGRVAVDTELAWHGPLSVQSTSSGLQDNGVPAMVGITRHGDVEYEVYQTIVRLKDKVS